MKKGILLIITGVFTQIAVAQYDWDTIVVPVNVDNGVTWELVEEMSDDFNYESTSVSQMGSEFYAKWKDGYVHNWFGPANTNWTSDASIVTGGNLEITATRNDNGKVNFQCISTKTSIKYPAYIETRMKIMNSVMANAVWMINRGSTEEIDVVEGYGKTFANSNNTSRTWFAQRMHLAHHTFVRSPFQDYQPKDAGSWHYDGTYWKDDFRIVGVYWRDPFHLEYYIDGELVRTVSGADMIDPDEHLGGNGLTDEEYLLISGASQGWLESSGVYPTDDELAVTADNIFKVDWVRTYKRIGGEDYVPPTTSASYKDINEKLLISNPVKDYIELNYEGVIQINLYSLNGLLIKESKDCTGIDVSDLPTGIYILRAVNKKGNILTAKVIK